MSYRSPFTTDEWYHCFNRGVDKRKLFLDERDYERFLLLMYVGNGSRAIHISNLANKQLINVLSDASINRGGPLVEIGAYSLMPNHFHFVLKEIRENGIPSFMQKVFTGYTMYFNKKNSRAGALLAGPFKSKHIADDRYLKYLISYVHLNPVELFESQWKEGYGNISVIEKKLRQYRYSSLHDFTGSDRSEKKLLGTSIFQLFDSVPSTKQMLEEAQSYYSEFIKASP